MALTAVAGAAAGVGQAAVQTAMQYQAQKYLNRQNQTAYRENLEKSHELNVKGQFEAIRQSTAALRAAGLSPALAAQGSYSAPAASAPLGSSQAGMPNVDIAGNIAAIKDAQMLDSQRELNKASARKLNADAQAQEVENQNLDSENKLIGQSMDLFLSEMRDNTDNPFMRGYLEKVLENPAVKNVGALRAFSRMFFDFSQKERDRELDFIAKEMDKKVYRLQYEDNRIAESLARKPYDERNELYKRIALMNMQIYSLASEASLTENKRSLLDSQAAQLRQLTTQLYHKDPAAMWQAGDYSAFLAGLGYDAVSAAASGIGFGVAAKVAGKHTSQFSAALDKAADKAKAQTETFKRGIDSNGRKALTEKEAKAWAARSRR